MAGTQQVTVTENVLNLQGDSQFHTVSMEDVNNAVYNPFLYRASKSPADILAAASEFGVGDVTVILAANKGSIPSLHPKALKEAIASQVSTHNNIDYIKLTRQGKPLI